MQPTVIKPLTISEDYWENFSIQESDLQFLYNHLLEIEIPLSLQELVSAMVANRIQIEKQLYRVRSWRAEQYIYPKTITQWINYLSSQH